VAIGGGVALCSTVTEDVVDGLGEEAAVEAEAGSGGSGVRWAGWIPSSASEGALWARVVRLMAERF